MLRILISIALLFSAVTSYSKSFDCGDPPSERFKSLSSSILLEVNTLKPHIQSQTWPQEVDAVRSRILQKQPNVSSEHIDTVYVYLLCNLIKKETKLEKDQDKKAKFENCCKSKDYAQRVID